MHAIDLQDLIGRAPRKHVARAVADEPADPDYGYARSLAGLAGVVP